jgi:anti-sigma factor RsiW
MLEPGDREFARLADWVEGRLSEEEARSVEERVAADSTMQADVAWLRAFNRVSKDTVIASPPPEVRDTMEEIFQEYAERKRRPGALKRFVAKLSFDSGNKAAPGWRVATTPDLQRIIVYSTEAADVTLSVRPRPHDGLLDIHGRIFPVNGVYPGAFDVQLLADSSEVATTATNELREFAFEGVSPGVYEISARSDRVEISILQIEVRQGGDTSSRP